MSRDNRIAIIDLDGHQAPVVQARGGRPVAQVVVEVHEKSVDDALADLAAFGIDRAGLDDILVYCAEQRCVANAASCPGCRRRTEVLGLTTMDDFVARHGHIRTVDGRVTLTGAGGHDLVVPSLDALGRNWMGEEQWYQARRVLRKLRHGTRSTASDQFERRPAPAVVLVEPQLADNIGMVGRAMANFGLHELRLVAPRDGWPNEKARIAASGATFIIDEAEAFPTFESAVADFNYVVATTARQRDLAKPVLTPEQAVAELRQRIANGQRCGILFGRERNGLESSEIANADAIVMAPVDKTFASLNLAQSVLLVAYEWMKQSGEGSLGRVTTYESPIATGLNNRGFAPASKAELVGFFEHLEDALAGMGFFNPPEKRPTVVQNLRSMFTRMQPTQQEVRTLRGIVKALVLGKGAARRGQ